MGKPLVTFPFYFLFYLSLIHILYNLTDTYWLGKIGTEQLAAINLEMCIRDRSEIRKIIENQRSNATITPPENTHGIGNQLG